MNEVKVFSNEKFGSVRTVIIDGEPWFVGKDIAEILGYGNTRDALISHVDEEDRTIIQKSEITTLEIPNRGLIAINESGLYSLILFSKLSKAKAFKHWVTSEVLPSIRKNGGYIAGQETLSDDELMAKALLVAANKIKERDNKIKELTADNERMKPKEIFSDAVQVAETNIMVGSLAKIIKGNGVDIGQHRLFKWMRQNGYLIKVGTDTNMPTQKSMNAGLFKIKERTVIKKDGSTILVRTPLVTGKGQIYFVNKFLNKRNR